MFRTHAEHFHNSALRNFVRGLGESFHVRPLRQCVLTLNERTADDLRLLLPERYLVVSVTSDKNLLPSISHQQLVALVIEEAGHDDQEEALKVLSRVVPDLPIIHIEGCGSWADPGTVART